MRRDSRPQAENPSRLTGALGGIGSATAAVLRESGYEVIGMDRNDGECAADHFIQCDIRAFHADANAVKETITKIRGICKGKLDLLVNNAAYQIVKPLEETSSTDWDMVMSTNVTAPFCLIREFLPELKGARGSIVNVSSIHANLTKPGFVAYATSKGALCALTRALAVELGDSGVRVNAILPAATATPMLLAGFEGAPEKFRELSSMHPVGRICDPKEIGEFIAFLGSVRPTKTRCPAPTAVSCSGARCQLTVSLSDCLALCRTRHGSSLALSCRSTVELAAGCTTRFRLSCIVLRLIGRKETPSVSCIKRRTRVSREQP